LINAIRTADRQKAGSTTWPSSDKLDAAVVNESSAELRIYGTVRLNVKQLSYADSEGRSKALHHWSWVWLAREQERAARLIALAILED
jgi:hypothetical protein